MKIFFVTDNRAWFKNIHNWRPSRHVAVEIFISPQSERAFKKELDEGSVSSIDLKADYRRFLTGYDIGFSCHCKQIFPAELVETIKCFNVHPGLNPHNRGWFPQVFSIINGLPVGATIHEMDRKIDHGAIVVQEEVAVSASDTSKSVYEKIIHAEFRLFETVIDNILDDNYSSISLSAEGNYNSLSDFKNLCEIDLDKEVTFRDAINYLRAMTFDGYDNAYFYDENGRKVYVSIKMTL